MLAALIRKEWLALARDLHGLAALFLMPLVFIIVMTLALQDVYNPARPHLRYAIEVRDEGTPARLLAAAWQRGHGAPQPLAVDWRAQLESGRLDYLLVLEPGLSAALDAPTLTTEPRIRLLTEPGMSGTLFNALRTELIGASGEIKGRLAFSAGAGLGAGNEASIAALTDAERFAAGGPQPTSVQLNVPAWLVFGMFFVVTSISGLFVQERSAGTLARLASLGVSRSMLLASKALPYLAVNALQALAMLAAGVWLMPLLGGQALSLAGVDGAALALVLGAISLAAVSLALALACAVRTQAQAATVGPSLNVLMAALGGIMVPTFVMPALMQKLAGFSPMNWGLEALLTVLLRGGGLAAALPEVGRLLVFATLMLGLAAALFRKTVP